MRTLLTQYLLSALVALGLGLVSAPDAALARGKGKPVAAAKAGQRAKAGKAAKKKAGKKVKKKRRAATVIADLTKDGKPNVQSRHGIVVDLDTDEVLWARQPDVVRPIASVSKLMACTVAVEKGLDLAATQTMTETDERVARGGARSRLLRGYTVTNEDLLYAALLGSDNRAVSALGRSVGLDAKQFAAAMTERARELGLKHTRFGDPTGLDERNVSTPREVLTMLKTALANETLGPILKTAEHTSKYTVGKGKSARAGEVAYRSTNRLIKGSPYKIQGGKTGFTNEAKYCFTVAGELDHGRRVAMTFLNGAGELTRFGDFRRVALYLKNNPPALIARPTEEAEVTAPAGAVPYKDEQTAQAAESLGAEGATETAGGGSDAPEAAPAPAAEGDPEDVPR